MPTFKLISKQRIGTGKNMVSKGVFIQIMKTSTVTPTSNEIKKAIKNQLGIKINSQPHLGQFNYEMLK